MKHFVAQVWEAAVEIKFIIIFCDEHDFQLFLKHHRCVSYLRLVW